MAGNFWELFVRRVTTSTHQRISADLNRLAEEIASLLAGFDAPTAAELLSSLNERIARKYDSIQSTTQDATKTLGADDTAIRPTPPKDPSDVGAPSGAPRPVPATPELIATVLQTLNEVEVAEELREIRSGGGRTLDQFIGELENLARQSNDSTATTN
jgi:hypothetical protein